MPVRFKLASAGSAISASPDFTQVIVAGRDVLRILTVNDGSEDIKEGLNLRTGRVNLNFSSNDVKWCPIPYCSNIIATAATNGSIVIWDLKRDGQKQDRVVTEHQRAVNRICFHPQDPVILLSASQDGTTKLWDLRDQGQARQTFEGKAESVRDVQFSPTESFTFATAFENGTVQTWDTRSPGKFLRRIAAHNGPVFAIDWHPSGKYIASGSRDKTIKVWDMRNDQRKASYTIQTFEAVGRLQWRPNEPNQLASAALLIDRRVHVWDLKRPYIPLYSFDSHEDTTTGILWQDTDNFFSCSKDQYFIKNLVSDAYQPAELYRPTSVSWNVSGDLSFTNKSHTTVASPEDEQADTQSKFTSLFALGKPAPRPKAPEKTPEQKLINVVEFKPGQVTGVVKTNTFHESPFVTLATRYRIDGEDSLSMCAANIRVAQSMGQEETVQFWKIIHLFLSMEQAREERLAASDAAQEARDAKDGRDGRDAAQESPKKSSLLVMDAVARQGGSGEELADESADTLHRQDSLDAVNAGAHLSLPSPDSSDEETEFLALKKDISPIKRTPKPEAVAPRPQVPASVALAAMFPEWDHAPVIKEMLEYFGETGDVQMCVTVLLVLKDKVQVTPRQELQWFNSYIELLQRFRLWTLSATITSLCKVPEIRSLSQESTTVHTTCNSCRKPLMNQESGYHICGKCRNVVSKCSFCHQPVRGVYVWCQGCSHGGHLEHMRAWFAKHSECPSGCGHRCNYAQSEDKVSRF